MIFHSDPPCHACGVEGPRERYVLAALVERIRMRWGSLGWRCW